MPQKLYDHPWVEAYNEKKSRMADATPKHRKFSVQRILDSRNAETYCFAYTRRRLPRHAQPVRESS